MRASSIHPLCALLAILALLLIACTPQPPAQNVPPRATGTADDARGDTPSEGTSLIGPTWGWARTTIGESIFASNGPERYTLQFKEDGTYQAQVDCNQMSGTYTLSAEGTLQLTLGPTTLIGCPPDSLDTLYTGYLGNAVALQVIEDGLEIELKDGAMMEFIQLP